MKKIKRIASAAMASSLCLASMTQVAFAEHYTFTHQNENKEDITNVYTDDISEAAQMILDKWGKNENPFTIYYYKPHTSDIGNTWYKVIVDEASKIDTTPIGGDYVKYGLSNRTSVSTQQYRMTSNEVTTYAPYIDFTFNTTNNNNNSAYITSQINSIINGLGLPSNATQYDKVKAVWDWMKNNLENEGSASSVDDLVRNKQANSLSSSLFMYRILKQMGVQTRIVYGSLPTGISGSGNHYWNLVSLDGTNWYHVDSTIGVITNSDNYFLTTMSSTEHGTMNSEFTTGTFAVEHPIATTPYNGESGGGNVNPPMQNDNMNYVASTNSYLRLHKDVAVPSLSISYSVANGTANSTDGVLAGINANRITISNAQFSNALTKKTDTEISLGENQAYVLDSLAINLQDMKYTSAGKYRYVITQNTISNSEITANKNQLFMDVSVLNDNGTLKIGGVTFKDASGKQTGFINTYNKEPVVEVPTHSLTITGETTGTGSDYNKVFTYVLNVQGLKPNTVYTLQSTNSSNPTTVTTNNSGVLNTTLSLKSGDVVVVNGLQENATYSIARTGDGDGYTFESTNATGILTANIGVTVKNKKDMSIDTGITTKVVPSVFALLAGIGGFFAFKKKKKQD